MPHSMISGLWLVLVTLFAATPASAEPVQITVDGLRLNGELSVPHGRSLSDGAVLITHGMLAHNRMEIIVALQEALAERDIPSLAITLSLGVDDRKGMFDCTANPNRHRQEDALDEIGLWLAWLKNKGAESVALLGHSAGGSQTARFAADRDEAAIRAVLLLAPATRNRERMAAGYGSSAGSDRLASLVARARAAPPDEMLTGIPFLRCDSASVSAASFLSYYTDVERFDTPRLLPQIAKPTLVVAGSEDRVVEDLPPRVEPLLAETRRLVVVDGADHFFRDLYMDEVADAVATFLEGRL